MPALLNAVGKLEVVAGDFESAEQTSASVAAMTDDTRAKAEAAHNLYLAALEQRDWAAGTGGAAGGDEARRRRFAPFPAAKFEPEKILGAGGFGVAFLCRNRHSAAQVVIKSLRRDGIDRDINDVFREAQRSRRWSIRRSSACVTATTPTPAGARPYLVMDYFQGQTLEEHVDQHGPLPRATCCRWRAGRRRACGGARRGHPAPRRQAGERAGARPAPLATQGRGPNPPLLVGSW